MTKLTGRWVNPCPNEGGVIGNAVTPGIPDTRGVISRAISIVVRLRSSQGTARKNTLPWATVGLPILAKIRSNSGKFSPTFSMERA